MIDIDNHNNQLKPSNNIITATTRPTVSKVNQMRLKLLNLHKTIIKEQESHAECISRSFARTYVDNETPLPLNDLD